MRNDHEKLLSVTRQLIEFNNTKRRLFHMTLKFTKINLLKTSPNDNIALIENI